MSEELKKMEGILGYIIPNRYVIGRTSDIVPVFAELTQVHQDWINRLSSAGDALQQARPKQSGDVPVNIKEGLRYFNQKSLELEDRLEEDDLIPMAPEVVNFLHSLQNYLWSASGKFVSDDGKKTQLLELLTTAENTFEESKSKSTGTSAQHTLLEGKENLFIDDPGSRIAMLSNQIKANWTTLVLAFEHLKFLRR